MLPIIQYAELKEKLVAARKQHDAMLKVCIRVGIKNRWSSMESPDPLVSPIQLKLREGDFRQKISDLEFPVSGVYCPVSGFLYLGL